MREKNIWKVVSIVLLIVILCAALVYGFLYMKDSYLSQGYSRGLADADFLYKQQIISGIQQQGFVRLDIPINETASVTLTLVPYIPTTGQAVQTQTTETGTAQ